MIYCFDPLSGDGDASEYKYKADFFKDEGKTVTYVFTQMMSTLELGNILKELNVTDEKIIWMHSFFADNPITMERYKKDELIDSMKKIRYNRISFEQVERFAFINDTYLDAYVDNDTDAVYCADTIYHGHIKRRNHYMKNLLFSEYYTLRNGEPTLFLRRFYNEDGSTALDVVNPTSDTKYVFEDSFMESTEEYIGAFFEGMHFGKEDTLIFESNHVFLQYITMYSNGATLSMTGNRRVFDIFDD